MKVPGRYGSHELCCLPFLLGFASLEPTHFLEPIRERTTPPALEVLFHDVLGMARPHDSRSRSVDR